MTAGLEDREVFGKAFATAAFLELLFLTAAGWHAHWLAHPGRTTTDTSNYIEAQVYEVPKESHLVEEKPKVVAPKHEAVLSKVPKKGKEAPKENKVLEDNQTESGQRLAPTHGPVAVFSPPPVIPAYLRDKELNTSVVIDFYVSALGVTTPRLAGSSGNQELDAIAVEAAKKWQFRPAEKDHKPIEAKVRLRIVFEVK